MRVKKEGKKKKKERGVEFAPVRCILTPVSLSDDEYVPVAGAK